MTQIVIIFQFIIYPFTRSTSVEVHLNKFTGRKSLYDMRGYNFIKLLVTKQMFFFVDFLVVYPSTILTCKCIVVFMNPVNLTVDLYQGAIFRFDTILPCERFLRSNDIMATMGKNGFYRFFTVTGSICAKRIKSLSLLIQCLKTGTQYFDQMGFRGGIPTLK